MEGILEKILNNERPYKLVFTLGTWSLVALYVLWEYFTDGVTTHHLLAREDLPGISNWWGLLSIPVLTWMLITLMQRRHRKTSSVDGPVRYDLRRIWQNFLGALSCGITVSLLWEFGLEIVLSYFILLPLVIALFRPVHLPECLLGFVLGMMFTFGGVLPIVIGLVLVCMSYLVHKVLGGTIRWIAAKLF